MEDKWVKVEVIVSPMGVEFNLVVKRRMLEPAVLPRGLIIDHTHCHSLASQPSHPAACRQEGRGGGPTGDLRSSKAESQTHRADWR